MTATRVPGWFALGGVAAGLAAGLLLAPFVSMGAPEPTPALASTSNQSQPVATSCADASTAISREVRRVTREELAAFGESLRADAVNEIPVASDAPDPIHVAAVMRARGMVDSAIDRRRWTEVDADSLRGKMAGLPADQRAEIIRLLSVAINQGQVVPESERLPF
jgi:hypothetical protein